MDLLDLRDEDTAIVWIRDSFIVGRLNPGHSSAWPFCQQGDLDSRLALERGWEKHSQRGETSPSQNRCRKTLCALSGSSANETILCVYLGTVLRLFQL